MPFWNKYPFTDFHELNLDWIISKVGQIEKNLKETLEAMAKAITAQEKAETAQAGAETAEDNAETAETNTREYYNNLVTHIAEDVTGWLDDNVNPVGSAVMVDSSLTISGSAGDAKVTGDYINALKNDITYNLLNPVKLSPRNNSVVSIGKNNINITNNEAQTYRGADFPITLKVGVPYTLSCTPVITSGKAVIVYYKESAPTTHITLFNSETHDDSVLYLHFTPTEENYTISFFCTWDESEVGNVTFNNVMLYEGASTRPYLPNISADDALLRNRSNYNRYIFNPDKWGQCSLNSSTGNIDRTTNERALLQVPIPDFINYIECTSVTSLLFAVENAEYMGVWNGNTIEKAFSNFDAVSMKELREKYPTYEFYVLIYSYVNEIGDKILFYSNGEEIENYDHSIVNTLSKYIETYYNMAQSNNGYLGYASNTGLYAEETSIDGQNKIQCSELLYAALRKTEYENSRYVNNENVEKPYIWQTDGDIESVEYMPTPYTLADYLRADQMAKYFDEKGMLIKYDANHNSIKPGDILYIGFGATPDNYKGIAHCAVISAYNKDANRVSVFDGSDGLTNVIGIESGVNHQYIALNENSYYVHLDDIIPEYIKYDTIAQYSIDNVTIPVYQTGVSVYIPKTPRMANSSFKGFATAFIKCNAKSPKLNFMVQLNKETEGVYRTYHTYYGNTGSYAIIPFAIPEISTNWAIALGCRNNGNEAVTADIEVTIVTGIHDTFIE